MQKLPTQIQFSRESLQNTLSAKKAEICNNKEDGIAILFAALAFMVPVVYTDIPIPIKTISVVVALLYAVHGVKRMRNKYTIDDLENDILALNEIASRHSIIVIRDTFNEFSSRYLVYYDVRWDCYLFPNYKTIDDNNERSILKHLSADLHVPEDSIQIEYKTTDPHRKYSVSNERDKLYEHALYIASFPIPNNEQTTEFVVADRKYRWMTYDEMLMDKRIQEANIDIVSWVHKEAI